MKTFAFSLFTVILILFFQSIAFSQDDAVRMFISTELKGDPAQMPEAEELRPGDAVYFVVKVNYKFTLGDLASTDPKTGKKNIYVCFDMNSYKVGEVCTGILKSPVSEQDLAAKSAVLTLVPATNDMNAGNIDFIRKMLDMIDSKLGQDFDLRITYKNYDNQKSASFKAPFSMTNYDKSRWYEYNRMFVNQETSAQIQKELATTTVPQAAMHDPALERQLLAAAQDLFGSTNKIYKAVFISRDWTYGKNEFGILMSRDAYVAIMRKETATGDCFVDQRLYAKQEFLTGNNWASLKLWWRENRPSLLHINCDKFIGFK